MDTAKIKALANGARKDLRDEISARLDAILPQGSDERLASPEAVHRLDRMIEERGRTYVVESAAYTWFNRLCALRFMDAKGYTPTPVVTPRDGSTRPAVLADAERGVFDPEYGFSPKVRERVASLLVGSTPSDNPTEDAYACLLRAVCEHYAGPMGYLFSEESASSLLMPSGLLAQGSILRSIVADMDQDACQSVEVLGWLYQFYIAERKQEVQDGFKKKGKAKKKAGAEELGPVTQLFTPEYIVRFLTQNSLGRLWMLNNPGSALAGSMEYYVAPQGDEPHLSVSAASEIRVIDPACGSGHILVYAYDLLFAMYEEEGWNPEDIPVMILQNNLRGLEIDGRAAEIAKFALEMKALEHDPAFLGKDVDADVRVLVSVKLEPLEAAGLSRTFKERSALLDAMEHMGEVGSLYVPAADDAAAIEAEIAGLGDPRKDDMIKDGLRRKLQAMLANVEALSGSYHCIIANPPYLGSGNMEAWLSDWVKEHYPNEKGDLCTCFIARGMGYTLPDGYTSIITSDTCMYLSSYEKMRSKIVTSFAIEAFIDTRGSNAHPDVFDANAGWVLCRSRPNVVTGTYIKLNQAIPQKAEALREAVNNPDCGWLYHANQQDFKAIPGWPIAYWLSEAVREAYAKGSTLEEVAHPKVGMQTSNNDKYLRLWWEIRFKDFNGSSAQLIWIKYLKGGDYRKWYGNLYYLLHYNKNPHYILEQQNARVLDLSYLEMRKVTWTDLTSGQPSFRYAPSDSFYDISGHCFFPQSEEEQMFLLGYVNTSFVSLLKKVFNSTFHFQVGDLRKILAPSVDTLTKEKVINFARTNVEVSKTDWDAFETSWDFARHPLVRGKLITDAFDTWCAECRERFDTLKSNEEELNRIFARIYGMEGEVPIEVSEDKVSVRLADLQRDVKSLVSYGIGCLFGRYSLDKPGLVLADQGSTVDDYLAQVPEPTLMPDGDNILPITEGNAWFDDDIVDSFYRFLAAAYGEDTLDENVSFIEGALGCDLRTYFARDFYDDHLKTYQKRPIYWLFQSPKKTFQCLVYLHRYDEGTVGEILTKYLRVLEGKLRARIDLKSQSKRPGDVREADKLRAQVAELEAWERDVMYPLAHERVRIDLDDGVKVNYNKFPHALAKVDRLSDWK